MATEKHFALQLFHQAAARVPAYKDFLHKNGVNPSTIKNDDDFKKLPLIDKKNYLTQYSLNELSWDGKLFDNYIISVSSGSTGEPFFWPRGNDQDLEGVWLHEQIYKNIFEADKLSTLVVICFSMGTWIAGSFTSSSTVGVAKKGYDINLVAPGLEQEEAIKAIKQLADKYDQIVLAGYPPFIKDVLDEGFRSGIKWKKLKLRFIWAGEAFSEEWRNYVLSRVGITNPYFSAVNIYGTADAALLGNETPVSVLARKIYNRRKATAEKVFETSILPSIVQYYPDRRHFEAINDEIVFSAYAGLPLVRYNIHDNGGVMSFNEMTGPIEGQFQKELAENEIDGNKWRLPFVYLNGRKDFTVTIYAVNIYPENIKAALVDHKMRSWVTGKFTMATRYHSDMDQYFEVNIELAKGVKTESDYVGIAKSTIIKTLMKLNAEFHKLHASIGNKAEPKINLIEHGNQEYFANGIKHRWVKKDN